MRLWRKLQYAISMVSILLLITGCGAPTTTPTVQPTIPPQPTEMPLPTATPTTVPALASSEERISSPDAPRTDLRELAAGNNAFAFDLYQALRDGEDNLLFSPFSLSQALAMTYAGARGETEQQMADTLHFTLPQERLHPAFNALDLELASRSKATVRDASGEKTEELAFELNIANAVWGQEGTPFLPEFPDVLALHYGTGIRLVDFKRASAAAVGAINDWVSKETEGRIQDLVDSLSEDTLLVLANAVYFNAEWDLPFDEDRTYDEPFYLLDGGREQVPMMHQRDEFQYAEGDGYQTIQLPYLNQEVAMVILLPGEGRFREIEERLTGEWVQEVVDRFGWEDVILTMPKFQFETPVIKLRTLLSDMGMPTAFSRNAEFFGIIERQPGVYFYIGDVLHKAFIAVDEKSTEAAAASAVIMEIEVEKPVATPPPPIVMKIDRPFIVLIRDIRTNTILFAGRVMNPATE